MGFFLSSSKIGLGCVPIFPALAFRLVPLQNILCSFQCLYRKWCCPLPYMPYFPLESHGLQVLTLFLFPLRCAFFFCFVKYILDAEDSKSASVINLYPSLSSFSVGSFVAPWIQGTYLSDAAFFHCFCHWWEIPCLLTCLSLLPWDLLWPFSSSFF